MSRRESAAVCAAPLVVRVVVEKSMSLALALAASRSNSMSSSFAREDSRSSTSQELDWSLRVAADVVAGARDRRVTGLETPVVLFAVVLAAADAAACERRVIGAIVLET